MSLILCRGGCGVAVNHCGGAEPPYVTQVPPGVHTHSSFQSCTLAVWSFLRPRSLQGTEREQILF